MPLFVSVPPSFLHGVFAQSVAPPATIPPAGTGVSIEVGQFPWGPANQEYYPGSFGAFGQTYAPRGMDRTNSAWLCAIRKAWPTLGAVRVIGPTAAASTATISSAVPTQLFTVTGKYPGTAGNGLIIGIGPAGNGNAAYFSMSVTASGASGSTVEFYDNLTIAGASSVLANLSQSALLASMALVGSPTGNPVQGNTTMSGGTNGTITSTQYVGTPGGNDYGFSLLEGDATINGIFTDDCGNSMRSTVNSGLVAHCNLTTNRIGYLAGNSGQSASAAQTDVANYRSIYCVYTDPWVYINDDTDGTMRLAPGSCWGASVAAQLPPSVSIAWKDPSVKSMLQGINSLESNRGAFRGQNTAAGIVTFIQPPGPNGQPSGYAFEAGVNTSTVAGQTTLVRSRMGIYLAQSAVTAWQPYVDAPNVPFFQQDLINSLNDFLFTLKNNAKINPAVLPIIANYAILPTSSSNTAQTIAAGQFTVASQVQIASSMQQIFLSMQYGETVTVQAA